MHRLQISSRWIGDGFLAQTTRESDKAATSIYIVLPQLKKFLDKELTEVAQKEARDSRV